MKYNIFTVLNEAYEKFGILFVSSAIDRLNLDKIENIFIYDTGLTEKTISKLKLFEKVKIIESGLSVPKSEGKLHDAAWQKIVYSKANLLKHCVESQDNFLPTAMIDIDSIFVQEFYDLIDVKSDLTLCRRSTRGRGHNHQAKSSHIGSFFSVNQRNEKTINFLENWVSQIEKTAGVATTIIKDEQGNPEEKYMFQPKESPALSHVYQELKEELKISEIAEPIISNIEPLPPREARIYHLKSDAQWPTIESRVFQPRASFYSKRYFL
tara:strand:- start:3782 stop:4582 length:801 start_codon:yes stop_codon:yes gene_type:complete